MNKQGSNNGNARHRTLVRAMFVLTNLGDWTTCRAFKEQHDLGEHERTVRRIMDTLHEVGLVDRRPSKVGRSKYEFRKADNETVQAVNPIRCGGCGMKFFDVEKHRLQTGCS